MTMTDTEAVARAIEIDYTNWRGERSMRKIVPHSIRYGNNEWHTQDQWLMNAWDFERQGWREFSINSIHGFGEQPDLSTRDAEVTRKALQMAADAVEKMPGDFGVLYNLETAAAILALSPKVDGYVMVPVEPTDAMIDAAGDFHANGMWTAADESIYGGIYRAMIGKG